MIQPLHGFVANSQAGGVNMSLWTRRRLVQALTGTVLTTQLLVPRRLSSQTKSGANADNMKALIFDVFGTLTDWRNSVAREAERLLAPLGYRLDWLAFADAWRGLYQPSMEEVRAGREPWVRLDVLHRRMLDRIRPQFGLDALSDDVADELNLAWHRLDTWPDIVPAFMRLRRKFLLAPCSNGNISIMVDIARRNGIPWDAILGSEIARDFKPKPAVYLESAAALGARPDEVVMVAAHSRDLSAAASAGLRTAHVGRLGEAGPGTGEPMPTVPVDWAAEDMGALATQLGT
jgi:2-haloacid dehalogenase